MKSRHLLVDPLLFNRFVNKGWPPFTKMYCLERIVNKKVIINMSGFESQWGLVIFSRQNIFISVCLFSLNIQHVPILIKIFPIGTCGRIWLKQTAKRRFRTRYTTRLTYIYIMHRSVPTLELPAGWCWHLCSLVPSTIVFLSLNIELCKYFVSFTETKPNSFWLKIKKFKTYQKMV